VWRNPVMIFGDYYLAHTYQSVDVQPIDFGPVPEKDWALDGTSSGTGRAKLISPLGDFKQRDDVGYDLADYYLRCAAKTAAMVAGVEPMIDVGYTDDADVVVVAFGTAGKYIRYTVGQMRADGLRVGYARPITLFPFPNEALVAATASARRVAVYENNMGQMVDDVRLAILGRKPVDFIGGLSLDSSGFGIAPDFNVDVLRRKITAVLEAAS
jgi:2-oxoglutarate ferredoxin oxidoreductase subunit alpha